MAREEAEWIFGIFEGVGAGWGFSIGNQEWRRLVEEVLEDALAEGYGWVAGSDDEVNEESAKDTENAENTNAENTEDEGYQSGEPPAEEMDSELEVEDIAEDAVEALHLLAEGYVAWFWGRTHPSINTP